MSTKAASLSDLFFWFVLQGGPLKGVYCGYTGFRVSGFWILRFRVSQIRCVCFFWVVLRIGGFRMYRWSGLRFRAGFQNSGILQDFGESKGIIPLSR